MSTNPNGMDLTFDGMHEAANHLDTEKGELLTQLQGLKEYVKNLTQTDFRTVASSGAFEEAHDEFIDGLNQMIDGLTGMAQFLRDAADGIEEDDRARAAGLNR